MKIVSEETKLKRKLSRLATKAKRKEQDCRVIELKLIESKFNQITKELINRFFVEAKWLWNHIIGDDLIGKGLINKPIYQVPVRYPDKETGEYLENITDYTIYRLTVSKAPIVFSNFQLFNAYLLTHNLSIENF